MKRAADDLAAGADPPAATVPAQAGVPQLESAATGPPTGPTPGPLTQPPTHPGAQPATDPDDDVDIDLREAARTVAEDADEAALGDREIEILAFERRWWKHAGSTEQAIRDTFGLSATRYYQVLNALLDDPAALAHDPVVVKRLRRLRATRTRSRGTNR